MPNAALVFFWGPPIRGREQKAIQVFNEVQQYYTRLKEQGEIESFEAVSLDHFGNDLNGFLIVRGDHDKLNRVRASKEGMALGQRSELICENFKVANAFIGEGLKEQFASYMQHAKELAT